MTEAAAPESTINSIFRYPSYWVFRPLGFGPNDWRGITASVISSSGRRLIEAAVHPLRGILGKRSLPVVGRESAEADTFALHLQPPGH